MYFGRMLFFALLSASSPLVTFSQKFEIEQFRPNTKVDMKSQLFNKSTCERLNNESVICFNVFTRVLGVPPKASSIRISNGKIARLHFSGDQSDFAALNRILTGAYGKPCRVQEIDLTSESINQGISSLKQSWCFPTGVLTLTERSYLSDNFSFIYQDRFNKRSRR